MQAVLDVLLASLPHLILVICCLVGVVGSALPAVPGALDHAVAGHEGVEPGHARLLARLEKRPLLRLGLRLGEGSGAALAIGVLQGALACHSGMATFAEAGVASG